MHAIHFIDRGRFAKTELIEDKITLLALCCLTAMIRAIAVVLKSFVKQNNLQQKCDQGLQQSNCEFTLPLFDSYLQISRTTSMAECVAGIHCKKFCRC